VTKLFLIFSFTLLLTLPYAFMAKALGPTNFSSSSYLKSACYKRFLDRNYKLALDCTENAAEKGDEVAEYYYGLMYYKGYGVRQDHKQAYKWFTKSADHDYAPAQNSLGVMFDNGQGVIQNFRTAFSWYLKAASRGHVIAQYNIGNMFYKGRGVLHDYKQAYVWFLIAASNGHREAMQLRDSLSITLLPKQVELAQDEAKIIADAIDNGSILAAPVTAIKEPLPVNPLAVATPPIQPVVKGPVVPSVTVKPVAAMPVVAKPTVTKPAATRGAKPVAVTPLKPNTVTKPAGPVATPAAKSSPAKTTKPVTTTPVLKPAATTGAKPMTAPALKSEATKVTKPVQASVAKPAISKP
jgi:hypothetical protein